LTRYLKKIGLYEKRSGDKFIPNDILRLKNEQIAIFLNRLYSCDGGIEIGEKNKTREINYASKSELLIKQLQHLLLRFNIISKIKCKNKRATNSKNHKGDKYYQLTISGKENIINFYKYIGMYQKEKKQKLLRIYNEVLKLVSNTNVDVIPKGVLDDYFFKYDNKTYAELFNSNKFRKNAIKKHNVSLRQFKMLANIENDIKLNMFANSDIFWDRVESIKKIDNKDEVTVYDLEVDNKNHNFIANDIVIHNSSAALMLGRAWCQKLGIRFKPDRHMAYSNRDVMNKIDMLNPFEPLICLTGDSNIKIRKNNKEYEERIDNLINLKDYEVLTYNIKEDKYEYKKPKKSIKQPCKKKTFTIELENGRRIKATSNHLILTKKGYKKVKDLSENDEIKIYEEKCLLCGHRFIKNKYNIKYCSKKCSNEVERKWKINYLREYRKKNKNVLKKKRADKIKNNYKKYRQMKRDYEKNSESYRKWKKNYQAKYYRKNKIKLNKKHKNWVRKNKNKMRLYAQKKHYKMMKTNIQYKIKRNLRKRLQIELRKKFVSKKSSIEKILGCSVDFFKKYIESKFVEGMSWDNYGFYGWHIDHIIPCVKFNLEYEEEQKKCFNYKNLQPLWATENLSKGGRI